MADMNDIALRLGWVAINASRVEVLIAFLQVVLGAEEGNVVGAQWSANYESCKAIYRSMRTESLRSGDTQDADKCRLFYDLLIELNGWMTDRHHVLHAIWEQDQALDPGNTLGLRRRGVRQSGAWPVSRLDALNRYLEAAHKMIMVEMNYRLARRDGKSDARSASNQSE